MGMLGSERDGLAFLKSKAKETKMYNLLSATLLDEANLCLSMVGFPLGEYCYRPTKEEQGESIPKALEYMYQASHLNIKEHINNYGSHSLLQSSFYSRLGVTHLSRVYCNLLLDCYKDGCPIEDRIRATCRSAFNVSFINRIDDNY